MQSREGWVRVGRDTKVVLRGGCGGGTGRRKQDNLNNSIYVPMFRGETRG